MKYVVNDQIVLMRPPEGPLAAFIRPFFEWAREQGYAPDSLRQRIRIAIGFSRWLAEKSLRPPAIHSQHTVQYLHHRARRMSIYAGDAVALQQFQKFLCDQGVISAERVSPRRLAPAEQCAQDFEQYLSEERALATATIVNYVPFIRGFLEDRFRTAPVRLSSLTARDVVRFVQRQAPRLHLKRAKLLTCALRAFLQYGCYRGEIPSDLAAAVPAVANWSMPSIPRGIASDQVRRLLASVNRGTAVGRRDYAILLLLARLGLRAGEIAFLELDDIDWKAGCLNVCGKSGRRTQLPLPKDAGDAIVAYLQDGRPRSATRRVFLTARAPIRGFLGPSAVSTIVRHALPRAGVKAPTAGAHQFRHGLATEMLRQGASLSEIGQLLGHRSPETTKIYTKVDLDALRTLAMPWLAGLCSICSNVAPAKRCKTSD